MLVREFCDLMKCGHLIIIDAKGNEICNGTIENEKLLDLGIEYIEPHDGVFIKVKVRSNIAEKKLEIKKKLRKQAEELFSLTIKLEKTYDEVSEQWVDSELDSEEDAFWNGMRNGIMKVVGDLNNAYDSLDKIVDDDKSIKNYEPTPGYLEEVKEFDEMLKEIDSEEMSSILQDYEEVSDND